LTVKEDFKGAIFSFEGYRIAKSSLEHIQVSNILMICYSYFTKHTSKVLIIPQLFLWAQLCPSTFTWRIHTDKRRGWWSHVSCPMSKVSSFQKKIKLPPPSLTTVLNEMCPKTLISM
jgi:hypothetical protein